MLRVFFFLLLVSLSNISLAVRFEQAAHNFQNKNYPQSLSEFKSLSELGNKDAQYQVGVHYYKGWGTEKDLAKAHAWFTLSSSQGDAEYKKSLAALSAKMTKDQVKQANVEYDAIHHKYSDEACAKKFVPAVGAFTNKDNVKAQIHVQGKHVYPRQATDIGLEGNVMYQFIVGKDGRVKYPQSATYTDKIFKNSTEKALLQNIYIPAYLNGNATETYGYRITFVYKFRNSDVNERGLKKRLTDLKLSAENGSSIDRYRYATALRSYKPHVSEKLAATFDNPNKWLLMSAVDGLTKAKVELASNVLHGEQCLTDFQKSHAWLKSAVQDNDPHAKMLLGLELYTGERMEHDAEKGIILLGQAAKTYVPAKIEYAKILATSDLTNVKNIKLAQRLLDSIGEKDTIDHVSLYEAKTIVAKVGNDEKNYLKFEKKLRKKAKKFKLPIETIVANIDRIIRREPLTILAKG